MRMRQAHSILLGTFEIAGRVARQHRRLEAQFVDRRYARLVQPGAQIGRMMIHPECRRREARGKYSGCQNECRVLVLQQPKIAGFRLQAEEETGLVYDVDVLLEAVGNAAIPHRDGEKVAIGGNEAIGNADDLIPGRLLDGILIVAQDDVQFCRCLVAVEDRQVRFPEVEFVNHQVRILGAESVEIGLGDLNRFGFGAARRSLQEH